MSILFRVWCVYFSLHCIPSANWLKISSNICIVSSFGVSSFIFWFHSAAVLHTNYSRRSLGVCYSLAIWIVDMISCKTINVDTRCSFSFGEVHFLSCIIWMFILKDFTCYCAIRFDIRQFFSCIDAAMVVLLHSFREFLFTNERNKRPEPSVHRCVCIKL